LKYILQTQNIAYRTESVFESAAFIEKMKSRNGNCRI